MRTCAVGVTLAILLTAPAARAQTADLARAVTGFAPVPPDGPAAVIDPALQSQVRALVAGLGAADFRARETAGRELLALGDRALPALKLLLRSVEDPEAQRRLEAIVRRLDSDRLRSARRVSLKAVNKSPREIIAEIARQSGYPIRHGGGSEDSDLRLSLDLADVPFWLALDRVCDLAGLTVNDPGEEPSLTTFFSDTFNPYASYDGPFKVVAAHVAASRNLQLASLSRKQPNPRQPEYINLNLTIQSEPKAPIVGVGQAVVTRAVDDRGESLLPPAEPGASAPHPSYYPPTPTGNRSFAQTIGVSLVRADRAGSEIRELRGKVPVALLSEVRPEVVVPGLLGVKKKSFPGKSLDVEVGSADFRNGTLAVELTFRRRTGEPDDYTWLNGLHQRVEVTDAAGARLRFTGLTSQHNGPGLCTLGLQFTTQTGDRKTGKPDRLYFMEWVTVTHEVSFHFKDLPLP
jgi:hypothetical protein